jgi:2-C-methyl-D-erythritol 4-phosphate cytidylyltransferase
MNIAIIFAGGQGSRLHNYSRPKQFLEYRGKPIVVYTIEVFQRIPEVDGIIVACLDDWLPYLQSQVEKYGLSKVVAIVPGGRKGQDSIYNALCYAEQLYPADTMMLIHDGVRPLALDKTISESISIARQEGNCVVCVPALETVVVRHPDGSLRVPDRTDALLARAPQCFSLGELMEVHRQALADGIHDFVDTCTMMYHYGHPFHTIMGTMENIKITTPADYFMFRAIMEAREEGAVFGL